MLKSLTLSNFRVLNQSFGFSPGVNIVYGDNGAGKSSILEAIHLLSFGRSFRASNSDQMISHDCKLYTVQANVKKEGLEHNIGVSREHGRTLAKLNGDLSTMSRISALLPALFIDCDSHRNYFSSSQYRRRLFDWLMFHVEPDYIISMRSYAKALKQRNVALKQNLETESWDKILNAEAQKIHAVRSKVLKEVLEAGEGNVGGTTLVYNPGYSVEKGLLFELRRTAGLDRLTKRTSLGPHKADFQLRVGQENAAHVLSQGQQKITYFRLMLLHYDIMRKSRISPLILMDDVPAELDKAHKALVQEFLKELKGQAIITAINYQDLNWVSEHKLFHVEHA